MEVLKLIEELEDLLEDSSSLPFSKKVMVDTDEVIDLIQEIRIRLPDEMQQASWIKEEKERILGEAEKEANLMRKQAEERVSQLIHEDGVSQAAEERAEQIILRAQEDAKEIRLGALEYADDLLMRTQEQMQNTIELISENREELRG